MGRNLSYDFNLIQTDVPCNANSFKSLNDTIKAKYGTEFYNGMLKENQIKFR